MEGRARRGLGEQFPPSVDTPLPQGAKAASLFSRESTPEQVRPFWESHLPTLEKLVQDSELAQEKWGGAIPDGIKPAAGKLKTVAISQLMDQCGLQGKRWVRQFALGSPVTGELSQRSLTSVTGSAQTCYPGRPSLNLHLLVSKKGHLSVGRLMPRSCGLKLPIRWRKGSCAPRNRWAQLESPVAPPSSRRNIAFRFGVKQGDKMRACYDLKRIFTNRCCHIKTPIQSVSRDHLAQLPSIMAEEGGGWHLFKAAHARSCL